MEEIDKKDLNLVNIDQNIECASKEEHVHAEQDIKSSHIDDDTFLEGKDLKTQDVNNELPHKNSEIQNDIPPEKVSLVSEIPEPSEKQTQDTNLESIPNSELIYDTISLQESSDKTTNDSDELIVEDENYLKHTCLDEAINNDASPSIFASAPGSVTTSLQVSADNCSLPDVDSCKLPSAAGNSIGQISTTPLTINAVQEQKSEKQFASPNENEQSEASPSPSATLPKTHQPYLISNPTPPQTPPENLEKYNRLQGQLKNYEIEIEQLKKALSQKDNTIVLYQRENALLEKEKLAFRKEKELATKEKESIVITFATKEKSLIDAKKQKDVIEKQLADSRKEVKNISTKFHALNEEKSRITYMLDEKCNEIKKYQKELEKQKTDYSNLEMKLKWNSVRLAQETEAKLMAEKKLEDERNAPKPHEEQAKEKIKMEYEANAILFKHEIENKDKSIETLTKEQKQATEKINQLQESLGKEILENTSLSRELECLRQEHAVVQNSYSEEMLNSAKLRGQLEELQVLRTQNTLNEDKINTLNVSLRELEEKLLDSSQDLEQLQAKEQELLSINKEMSEMIVGLQNEICLQTSRVKGIEAENEILKKEKQDFDTKNQEIESHLKREIQQKNDDRLLFTKHLSEKTKLYESVKVKLENAQGDLDATKKKHSQVVKELQREIQKFKKISEENTSPSSPTTKGFCRNCQSSHQEQVVSNHSRAGSNNSRSDSESEVQSTTSTMNREVQGPSKQHLVERILRLQQASARQTEKIDFLENHTLSLVSELQKKSKVVQYYMMRDQAGALTSSKSDHNKTELAKYGGVMSAIYSGIKGPNQSMTLELSLEINKKLQAVLEDTLLKNITLKENLDVLGLEVDKLTRKLAQLSS